MSDIDNSRPLSKRKRVDDVPNQRAVPANPVRSDIWYEDGNVILQAGGTQFKVYRGALADNSTVFKDMFSFPQPPSTDMQMIEGCPVVHLSDSAQEVRYMLEALCQRKYASFGETVPWPVIPAFFLLGRKYDIQQLRTDAQKRFFSEFPATFQDFTTRRHRDAKWTAFQSPHNLFEPVIFARKSGLLSVLPYMLYSCCMTYTASQIMESLKSDDGTVVSLPVQDQLACIAGYRAIIEAQAETTHRWIHYPEDFFPGTCQCADQRKKTFYQVLIPAPILSALYSWDVTKGIPGFAFCDTCTEIAHTAHDAGTSEFWTRLPRIFGLPPWEELVKERKLVD